MNEFKALRSRLKRIKSSPDGIHQGGDLHQQLKEGKKGAGVAAGVEARAEVPVLRTRQGQRHLILSDLERKLQNQKAKEGKARRGKRMLKG